MQTEKEEPNPLSENTLPHTAPASRTGSCFVKSYYCSDVAKELDLKGRKEVVSVSTLLQQEDEEFEVVEFKLQSASGEGEVITVEERLVTEKFNSA